MPLRRVGKKMRAALLGLAKSIYQTITRPVNNIESFVPFSLRERPLLTSTEKIQETGPTVYRFHPKILEWRTIC